MGKVIFISKARERKNGGDPTTIPYSNRNDEDDFMKTLEFRNQQGNRDILSYKIYFTLIVVMLVFFYTLAIWMLGVNVIPKKVHTFFWAIVMYYTGSLIVKDDYWYYWPIWYGVLCIFISILYFSHVF